MQVKSTLKPVILLVLFSLITGMLPAQDSLYVKRKLTAIDIEAYYSFYGQDGNHSAVTGGVGTEELTVNSVGANLAITVDTVHTVIFETYLDVITSASTDNIDFVKSSASLVDNHLSIQAGYQYTSKDSRWVAGLKYMFGMESDYLSNGFNLWSGYTSRDRSRAISLNFSWFFDDLRWGRLNPETGHKPTTLVYPYELRYKQWFDIFMRYSYNLMLSLRQDVNRRISFQLDLGTMLQQGLLSTPFHRIYFADSDSGVVENLPRQRWQFPLGVGMNAFATRSWVINAYYSYFTDDLGIRAHAISLETPVKLSYRFSLYPFARFYTQTAAYYFRPYGEHLTSDTYFTSDYDLSAFNSIKAGLGIGFYPDARMGKRRWSFDQLLFRYSYYYRTDGLDAHILSLMLNVGEE